jgi:hypothetical protein
LPLQDPRFNLGVANRAARAGEMTMKPEHFDAADPEAPPLILEPVAT